jgi:hypothetical protein
MARVAGRSRPENLAYMIRNLPGGETVTLGKSLIYIGLFWHGSCWKW